MHNVVEANTTTANVVSEVHYIRKRRLIVRCFNHDGPHQLQTDPEAVRNHKGDQTKKRLSVDNTLRWRGQALLCPN